MPSSVGKKIRDLERLVTKLNGKIDDGFTKRLAQLKEEKRENEVKMKERTNSVKYHMVKFVERKKIIRKVKSVDRKIKDCNDILCVMRNNNASSSNNDEFKQLQRLVEDYKAKRVNLHHDLAYILYYPKDVKYISLFNEEDDIKSKKLIEIAREKALNSRQHDLDCGNDDKVLHAIMVEYQSEQSESGKIKTKKRSIEGSAKSIAAKNIPFKKDEMNQKDKPLCSNNDKSDSDNNRKADSSSSSAADSSSDDSSSDDRSSDDRSSDDRSSGDSSDKNESKKETDVPNERKEQAKKKELSVKSATGDSTSAGKQIENDAFFLEEKGDVNDDDHTNVQDSNGRRPSRGRAEKPYILRAKGRPSLPLQDTSNMTKQELRLYQWHMKRKSNNLGRIHDLSTVRKSRDGFVIDGVDNKSRSKTKSDSGKSTQGDNHYNKFEAKEQRNRSNKGDFANTTVSVDDNKFTNKSAWELGKGISAKSATELVKQKNTGAIKLDQPPQAKKIKFDD